MLMLVFGEVGIRGGSIEYTTIMFPVNCIKYPPGTQRMCVQFVIVFAMEICLYHTFVSCDLKKYKQRFSIS
jgi:hypothetical protein